MDTADYFREALRQLHNTDYYLPLEEPMSHQTTNLVAQILNDLSKEMLSHKKAGAIPERQNALQTEILLLSTKKFINFQKLPTQNSTRAAYRFRLQERKQRRG
ncbi:Hypothetical predicted protein [Scomber scombrus]|uniref:Uncharacterized protein n=1 Tax=Scomber scombrus TaxID=13677 RepID=A0AAV1PUU1_SCOSC